MYFTQSYGQRTGSPYVHVQIYLQRVAHVVGINLINTVVLLTVKNPFISRDIFAHVLPRLRLRIHEIKALKIYLFCS